MKKATSSMRLAATIFGLALCGEALYFVGEVAATTVTSCGASSSQNGETLELSGNLTCTTGDGISVTHDGVTVDCHGYAITGANVVDTAGIEVTGGDDVTIRNCTVQQFHRGIQLKNVVGGLIDDSTIQDNDCCTAPDCSPGQCEPCNAEPPDVPCCQPAPYGIEISGGSREIIIQNSDVLSNGDEGIHVSGKSGSSCPDTDVDWGENQIIDTLVADNKCEGIYLLCSDRNRVVSSAMVNNITENGLAGIFLDEHSGDNWIEGNALLNDPIEIREASERNVVIDNTLTEDGTTGANARLKINSASRNFVSNTIVDAMNETEAYVLQSSATCIVIRLSTRPRSTPATSTSKRPAPR